MKQGFSLLLLIAVLFCASPALAYDAKLFNLWPVLDYRASASADYQSLHLLGPLVKYETKGFETEYALRPLFYRAVDETGLSQTDLLYPVFGHKRDRDASSFHAFHLLNYDFGHRESGSRNRSYLFPFLFYGEEERGRYFAVFPIHGTLYEWFGRERISFTLFPLYAASERQGTRTDNLLWPFFAKISGENESGFKAWPLVGASHKEGVYSKKFFLWPIFFTQSLGLDTDNPTEMRAVWPFYVSSRSPTVSSRTVLWPFFSRVDNTTKKYRAWNAPWPLVRVTRGEKYHGLKILPFYADETMDVKRQRWYLWPFYKIEQLNTDLLMRRRDRVLFFLYSDVREFKWDTGDNLRRVDFWPFFSYEQANGVSLLHVLSLVEPLFPGNRSIERLWSPLWRVYQQKWDHLGNRVISLFWNLFWSEKQGNNIAWELFPVLEYRKEAIPETNFRFLKGLISYRNDSSGKHLNLFYLPWGVHWGAPRSEEM